MDEKTRRAIEICYEKIAHSRKLRDSYHFGSRGDNKLQQAWIKQNNELIDLYEQKIKSLLGE